MKPIDQLTHDKVEIMRTYTLIKERYEEFVRRLEELPSPGDPVFQGVSISINENRSLIIQYLNRELLMHHNYDYDEVNKGMIDCSLRTKDDEYTVLHSFKYDKTGMTDIEARNDGRGYAINSGKMSLTFCSFG